MKKRLKWILLGVAVVVVIAVVVVWLTLDGIVRRTVQTQATDSLNLQTTVGGANVSLLGGSVGLSDLAIDSPKGFESPHMFTLNSIKIDTSFSNLSSDPIGIQQININSPVLVIEQANGKFNFQTLMDLASKQPPDSGNPGDGKRQEGEPIRLIVHQIAVNGAQVVIRPGIPGLQNEIKITVPAFQIADVGTGEGNKNGVAIKQVVAKLVSALAEKASQSDQIPPEVRQLLTLNVDQMKQQIAGEVNKQVGKLSKEIEKNLPPEVGKQATDAIQKGLGNVLNQGQPKPKRPTTTP